MVDATRRRRWHRLWVGVLTTFLLCSCSTAPSKDASSQDPTESDQSATSCDNSAIFGFESASKWTASGGSVSANTRRIQGNQSLEERGGGHIELRSAATCGTGASYDALAFDLASASTSAPKATVSVSVKLDSTSRSVSGVTLGPIKVDLPENGFFTRVEFTMPAAVSMKLASAYSDLRITLIADSTSSSQDYLFDDLSLHVAQVPPVDGTGAPQTESFTLTYPSTADLLQLGVLGEQAVTLGTYARVTRAGGGFGGIASAGTQTTSIGATAQVGTIISVPNVSLGDNSKVTGDVVTSGSIARGASVVVTGQSRPGTTLTPLNSLSWTVNYGLGTENVVVAANKTRVLVPGAYASVDVKYGGTLTLSTGTYYFESFVLETGSKINIVTDNGPVFAYTKASPTLRGSLQCLGRPADFLLATPSNKPFAVEMVFSGFIVAPSAAVRLAAYSTAHEGAVFAASVSLDKNAVLSVRPALPIVGAVGGAPGPTNKDNCAVALVGSSFGQTATPRALQEALLRYCGHSDVGPCETTVLAQINLDYFLGAKQLVLGTLSPSNHLAFMLDRERKAALIHGNESLACQIVNGDPDGDLVPQPRDTCANTPSFVPTLDNGCPDPTPPPGAPPLVDILKGMPLIAIPADPRCIGAPSPTVASPFGAWRFPADPTVGKAVWISRDRDTSGCPKWYVVEAKLTDGSIQTVAFRPEQDVTLPWIKRATDILQFNIHQSDGSGRGAWANYGVFTDRYRVQVVNAAGRKSAWSDWFRPGQEGCAAGACSDF